MFLTKVKTLTAAVLTIFLATVVLVGHVPCPAQDRPDQDRIKKLIENLGSDEFAVRERAARELVEIGEPALELLRKADKSGDEEISKRAARLVTVVEAKALTAAMLAPRKVRLDLKGVPVAEAVAELAKVSGYRLELVGDRNRLAGRKVTLTTKKVTFWEALDLLCREARLVEKMDVSDLVARPAQLGPMNRGGRQKAIQLMGGTPQEVPTYLAGAVRIHTLPLALHKDRVVSGGEAEIVLQVTGEPRLEQLGLTGLTVKEAVDDQGQKLAAAPVEPRKPKMGNNLIIINDVVIESSGPAALRTTMPVRFKLGEKAARRLKTVSGIVSLQALKEPEVVVTVNNLLKAAGETVKGREGHSVVIHSVDRLPEGGVNVKVVLEIPRQNPLAAALARANVKFNGKVQIGGIKIDNGNLEVSDHEKPDLTLELLDAGGKVMHAEMGGWTITPQGDRLKIKVPLTYRGKGEPAQLVLYGRKAVTFSVPFTLKGVPLP
jgi:hypothetical protein